MLSRHSPNRTGEPQGILRPTEQATMIDIDAVRADTPACERLRYEQRRRLAHAKAGLRRAA